ncbi:MAG TPA: catalase family peroxidase [Terriglobia bacterium]|nr:catalase family peroxidase [Terriglobia bacterium]
MAMPSSATSPQKQELYERIVDAFELIFGTHPGYRAAHAKGIVCEGTFTPAAAAASLSRALHFQRGSVPVTIRFSDATGVPTIPDADPNASPRGLGIKFHLPGGTDSDIVAHSYNGFPVGTAEEFLGFVQALAASGPSAQKPTPIEIFLGTRPRALAFATGQKPAPVSFMTESYYGVNAFRFINRQGASQYARYQIHPAGGEAHLNASEAAQRSQDFLFDELRERLSKGSAELSLVAQIAGPGDRTDDGSITWPDDRRILELGTLRVIKIAEDSELAQRKLIFDPTRLTDGIELSDDPLLPARAAIYSISYKRRNP